MKNVEHIVFLGTSAFAVPALRALAAAPAFDILMVITQPDRPVGRKQILTASPVKIAAQELGIRILQPESMNEAFAETQDFASLPKPDYVVVVSYGQILSQEILDWPKKASLNIHASLLPTLRGASPIQHTILLGEKDAGVTVQQMVYELDAGPVICQRSRALSPRETFATLHDTLADLGAEALLDALTNAHEPKVQDPSKATFCKKLQKSDGEADPKTMTADHIDRMIRALTPWPGVVWNGNKLLEASLQETPKAFPLSCAEQSTLYVVSIQAAGGRPMDGASFLRGHPNIQ